MRGNAQSFSARATPLPTAWPIVVDFPKWQKPKTLDDAEASQRWYAAVSARDSAKV